MATITSDIFINNWAMRIEVLYFYCNGCQTVTQRDTGLALEIRFFDCLQRDLINLQR